MAILKNIFYPIGTAAVLEDPTPGATKIYMQLDAYDKTTLSPLFNQGVNHNTTGTSITGFGYSYTRSDANYLSGYCGRLLLNGPVVEVQVVNTSNNNSYNSIDPMMFHSMDPTRPIRRVRYDTNGVNAVLGLYATKISAAGTLNRSSWNTTDESPWTQVCLRLNPTSIETTIPFVNERRGTTTGTVGSRGGGNFYPVYFNTTTGNMVILQWGGSRDNPDNGDNSYNATKQDPSSIYGSRFTNYLSSTLTWEGVNTYTGWRSNQFVGVDNGGRAIFFHNDLTTDYNHMVVRYNDSDNTGTVLFNNSVAPSAGGTSAGGNRGTSYGNYVAKYSSQTFNDPTSAGNVCWYTPYQDSVGKYHPFWYQWNRTTDTFTRNSDITVNWGAQSNQDNVWSPDTVSSSAVTAGIGLQRLIFNETWTVSGTRYLMMGQLHGSGAVYDTIPKARTFVVFTVDAANPKLLTYHSQVTIPATPKNIIFFNDAKTQLGVFSDNAFYTYNFTAGAGWTLTATMPYRFSSVGVDSLGRIWALAQGTSGYGEIHMITLNVPVTITVSAPQTSYNFTGTNINSSLTVNAYDQTGARIAVAVKLVIDGGSMTFAGSTLTTTINTSASADTTVPVTITGSGISNVIASVVL